MLFPPVPSGSLGAGLCLTDSKEGLIVNLTLGRVATQSLSLKTLNPTPKTLHSTP